MIQTLDTLHGYFEEFGTGGRPPDQREDEGKNANMEN